LTTPEELKKYVRDVPDYPQKGIIFRDITPLLGDKNAFAEVVGLMSKAWSDAPPDLVAAIEARGFIPKTGKLPWTTVMESYDLEYGTDSLEVHSDAVQPGQSVLIVDDVLATGGTASAAVRLMRKLGAAVIGVQVLIELSYLEGRRRLGDIKLASEIVY
jgi:adenine phosphoribosyltransferase